MERGERAPAVMSDVPEDVRRAIEAFVPAPDCRLKPRLATETSFIFDWGVRVEFEEDGRTNVGWICMADEACRSSRDSMYTLSHGRTSRATRHLRQVHGISSDKTERTNMVSALTKRRHDGGTDGEFVQRLPSVFSLTTNVARYVGASPSPSSGSQKQQIQFIATTTLLQAFLNANGGRLLVGKPEVVGVDFLLVDKCPEHQGRLCLAAISIAGDSPQDLALVLLVQNLDKDLLKKALRGLWIDMGVVKAMHSLRRPAVAWRARFDDWLLADPSTVGSVDLQLLFEHAVDSKEREASVATIATAAKVDDAISNLLALSSHGDNVARSPSDQLGLRDGTPISLSSCHRDAITIQSQKRLVRSARLLARVYARLRLLPVPIGSESARVAEASQWKQLVARVTRMTRARCENAIANNGELGVWFDQRADFQLRTLETLIPRIVADFNVFAKFTDDAPDDEDVLSLPTLRMECDIDSLLGVLPQAYSEAITRVQQYRDLLTDVCLDIGRVPYVYVGMRQRIPLKGSAGERMVVTKCDVDEVLELLGGQDRIGCDNCVGIDGQLHRVSVMRSKKREVYGLSIQVGRALLYAASGLTDLLLSAKHRAKSVLLLGHPRSGKTTLLRDVARFLSETLESVCIIDTFNEIGGEGIVPHESVGWARRMMVSSLEAQPSVMIECVQNHPVETMIVDEVGRKADVMAVSMVRQRGVRLVAGALGDLNSLLRHPELCGLLGSVAQEGADGEDAELRMRRVGKPLFDVIVELDRQSQGVFRVIWDVAAAVDCVLGGRVLRNVETRRWTATTRGVQILNP